MTAEMETTLDREARPRSAREIQKDLEVIGRALAITAVVFLESSASDQREMAKAFSSSPLPISSEIESSSRSLLSPHEVIVHETQKTVPERQQDTTHDFDRQVGDRLTREKSEEGWLWRGVPETFDEALQGLTKKLEGEKGITDVRRIWFVGQSLELETGEEGRVLTEEDTVAFGSQAQLIAERFVNSDLPEKGELFYKVGTNSNNIPILVADYHSEGRKELLAVFYPSEGEYHFVSPSEDPRIEGGSLSFRRGLVSATVDSPLGTKYFAWKHNEWVLINQPEGHHFIWKVKPGDTLWEISEMYGIPLEPLHDALERAEGHRDARKLQAGTELRIETVPSRAPFVGLKIPEIKNRTGTPGTEFLSTEPSWTVCYTDGSCPWSEKDPSRAWMLAGCPRIVFFHRDSIFGANLSSLDKGDEVIFYKNNDPAGTELDIEDGHFTDKLKLRVEEVEKIKESEQESKVLSQAESDLYALVSCHPPGDTTHPERIVVWLRPSGIKNKFYPFSKVVTLFFPLLGNL